MIFEALATICLAGAPDVCRDVLVPGIRAGTIEACTAALDRAPSVLPKGAEAVHCAPEGAALDLQQVAPGVYVHFGAIAEPASGNAGDVANLGVVIGTRAVAVIDAGSTGAIGEGLWRAIRARTDLPVRYLILTHMHPDHVFGAAVFARAGAEVVGHAGLGRALADRQETYAESMMAALGPAAFIGSGTARVDRAITDTAEIDLGGRVLRLEAWPEAHTSTDLTVSLPGSGIVFAGDLVFSEHVPTLDGSLRGWQDVLETLGGRDIAGLVPGHGRNVLEWPAGAAPLVRYLDTLARDTRAAIDDGLSLGDAVHGIARGEAPNWQLFDAFNARNATVAFTELEWE